MRKAFFIFSFLFSLALFSSAQNYNINLGGLNISSGSAVPGSCPTDGAKFFKNVTTEGWYTCITGSYTADGGAGGSAFNGGSGSSFQDVTAIATPANPSAGSIRLFASSGTGNLACLTSAGANCLPGGGSGTVTNIATTSPIGGGPITVTGTITCVTCVTSAASLTSNAVLIGGGGQASSSISASTTTTQALFATAGAPAFRNLATTDIPAISLTASGNGGVTANQGTTTTVLHGNAAGQPSFSAVSISADVSGLGTNVATFLGTPSSANLISAVTDETGTGALVFGTSPTFSTGVTLGFITGSTQCLHANTSGVISGTGSDCGAGGFSNPMTTLGDVIYENATPAAARLAGPTATNGVVQVLTETPASGAAVAPVWSPLGVSTNAQTGTSYTIAATDRAGYVSYSNAGSIAVTLPQAGSTGFASNFAFVSCAIGAGTATITPTTSTISYTNGSAYTSAASSLALTTGQCAWVYSDNTNYIAIVRSGGGSGVTSVATTSPITGGTITTTGTIACATCVTSAASLTSNGVMIGGGSQASSTISADTTTTHALFATAGAPAFRAIVAGDLPNIPINQVISATGAIATIADGNNPLVINCALTSGTTCHTLGETTAATTAGAVELQLTTLTASTAIGLQLTQGAAGPANAAAPNLINISAAASGGAASASNAGSAGAAISLLTGAGSAGGATTGIGGNGGAFTLTEGAGGNAGGTATNNGGSGGGFNLTTGAGGNGGTGAATAGSGGSITFTLGAPGTNSATGTPGAVGLFNVTGNAPASTANATGVNAGTLFSISGVSGGASSNAAGTAGTGSSPTIASGNGGAGTGTNAVGGAGGTISLNAGTGGASAGTGVNSNGGGVTVALGQPGTGGSGTAGKTGIFQTTDSGGHAGFWGCTQGTAVTTTNTNIPATSMFMQCPTGVTAYNLTVPTAQATNNNSAMVFTNAGVGSFAKMSQALFLTSLYTNATTTFSNVTGLSFSAEASTNYTLECNLDYQTTATTADVKIQWTGPASPTFLVYDMVSEVTASTLSASVAPATATTTGAFSTALSEAGTPTINTNFPLKLSLTLINGSTAGTVQLQAAATGTGTISILPGSCQVQ